MPTGAAHRHQGRGRLAAEIHRDHGAELNAYGTSWWWYCGQTAAQVLGTAGANNARPIAIHGYNTADGVRFATVMVSNTGANAEPWSFYYGSPSYISSQVTSTSRMVSFGRIQGTGSYTALFGSNTGSDNTGWSWYYGKTTAQLQSLTTTYTPDWSTSTATTTPAPTTRSCTRVAQVAVLHRLLDHRRGGQGHAGRSAAVRRVALPSRRHQVRRRCGRRQHERLESKLDGQVASKLGSGTHGVLPQGRLAAVSRPACCRPSSSSRLRR